MIKVLILTVLGLIVPLLANSQNELENNLSKHVHYLSSDDMKGRAIGSEQLRQAEDYIKNYLSQLQLQTTDFPILKDSLDDRDDSEREGVVDTSVYQNFYTVIASHKSKYPGEYILLTANYNGKGTDTIQKHVLINNGANDNASSTAVLMELVGYLQQNRSLLQRDVIILFSGYSYAQNTAEYFAKHYGKGMFKMVFDFDRLGYLGDDEDESKYTYSISPKIENASKILQPLLLNDVDIPTYADYYGDDNFPVINVSGGYKDNYEDLADGLRYDKAAIITQQLQKVIVTFDTADLKIDTSYMTSDKSSVNKADGFLENLFNGKNMSYFGLNIMMGSNKHYYTSGKMTGKSAMSYSAGIFYKFQFSRSYALRIDVNSERAMANRHDGRFKSDVISVPLSILHSAGWNDVEIYYGLGAYYDRMLDAQLEGKDVDWDYFKKAEWGWQFSIGLRLGHFIMGYYQKMGISDMMKDAFAIDGKIKNRNQYFTLGWKF